MSPIWIGWDWRREKEKERDRNTFAALQLRTATQLRVLSHKKTSQAAYSTLQKPLHHLKWQSLSLLHTMYVAISSGASPSRSNLKVTILWLWVSNWHSTILSPVLHTCNKSRHNKYTVCCYIIIICFVFLLVFGYPHWACWALAC